MKIERFEKESFVWKKKVYSARDWVGNAYKTIYTNVS